jgi:DNA-binding Lrp family transcriptional regulator
MHYSKRRSVMVTAMVLINTDRYKVNEVAEKLTEVKGISEVYSVAGEYDLVAVIRVAANEQLADIVTAQIVRIEGIAKTETLIAFRAFSRHDLEAMFSVGFNA